MNSNLFQSLLSTSHNERRITIGLEDLTDIRRLSDAKALTCPGCGQVVTLKAGTLKIHHFAHLAGKICTNPQTEPETPEHRYGKLLIAAWMREKLPEAEVVLEALISETGQRADILAQGDFGRVVIEYQCANLSEKEWRRRHYLYRECGIRDLWILGGSRMNLIEIKKASQRLLRTAELERTLFRIGAPLLFLHSLDSDFGDETLVRFRPESNSQPLKLQGKLTYRRLLDLEFPWKIFDWSERESDETHVVNMDIRHRSAAKEPDPGLSAESRVWDWLASRYHISQDMLADFFGLEVEAMMAFACTNRAWQAAIYYRFVYQRVGERWWLSEVENWARAHLPLARPQNLKQIKSALTEFQEILGASGMLSIPRSQGRGNAEILADITTLSALPSREDIERLARFRQTLRRER